MFTTPIIAPVSADLIRQELTPDKLLRATNKGGERDLRLPRKYGSRDDA